MGILQKGICLPVGGSCSLNIPTCNRKKMNLAPPCLNAFPNSNHAM